MDNTYWLKQTKDKPLYEELLWSRPENKQQSGKLLVIGGNLHGFSAPAEAYKFAELAGIGTTRVLLPDALKKTVGRVLAAGEYAPSTPSGSFNKQSLDILLEHASWADGVLVAGDLGRNSETAILLEQFLSHYSGAVTLTKDAVDYINSNPLSVIHRQSTALILSLSQLQRLFISLKHPKSIQFDMATTQLVELLHEFTIKYAPAVVTRHLENTFVAFDGQVSSTATGSQEDLWRVETAARSATWWLQNPNKCFESLTSAVYTKLVGEEGIEPSIR